MFEQTKALCRKFMDLGVPGVDIVVYQNGEQVLRFMDGYSDLEKKLPVKGNEQYHIYSCSKLITCVAALQLWEKGLFSLEDPLSKYIPEFAHMSVKTEDGIREAAKPILIKNLFTMTAGFTYNLVPLREYAKQTGGVCDTVGAIRQLAKQPLAYEPGESWLYSLAHDVLAALVEVLSGQDFESYVQENIFRPLGMKDTTFLLQPEDPNRLATLYVYHPDTQETTVEDWNIFRPGTAYASGGAGCVSTVEDYIRFCEALREGETLLKRETVAMMSTDQLEPHQFAAYNKTTWHSYGLGVHTPKKGGYRTDFGWGGAAGAYVAIDMEKGISLFYAQHIRASRNMSIRWQLMDAVLADLAGVPMEKLPEASENYTLTY